jgi:hypothetical protein
MAAIYHISLWLWLVIVMVLLSYRNLHHRLLFYIYRTIILLHYHRTLHLSSHHHHSLASCHHDRIVFSSNGPLLLHPFRPSTHQSPIRWYRHHHHHRMTASAAASMS